LAEPSAGLGRPEPMIAPRIAGAPRSSRAAPARRSARANGKPAFL